jgi:hypothetical protein
LNTGIVVGCIEAPESGNSLCNHCLHLTVIRDVGDDGERFVTLGNEFVGRSTR